jgi:hypothetical protein
MGQAFQCEYPTPKGISMPKQLPKPNARIHHASEDENSCSCREKEDIVVRRRKKRDVKKEDREKALLQSKLG